MEGAGTAVAMATVAGAGIMAAAVAEGATAVGAGALGLELSAGDWYPKSAILSPI